MPFIDKLKRDFARHKAKAGVLVVLVAVMLVFIGKAAFEMAPRAATAADPLASPAVLNLDSTPSAADSEHERNSRELWKVLLQKRGVDPVAAFTFDPASADFHPNPERKQTSKTPEVKIVDPGPKIPATSAEATLAKLHAELLEQTRSLLVRSTVVGSGISRPVAVISDISSAAGDRIYTIGDHIKGFEITAIRARAVDFKKDGVTLAVEMAHDPDR